MILKGVEVDSYTDAMYTGKQSHNSERISFIYLSKYLITHYKSFNHVKFKYNTFLNKWYVLSRL